VGLLPLALVGVDIKALVAGAGDMLARFWSEQIEKNPAAVSAVIEFLLDTKRGKNIQVIFPYANGLSGMAAWYCQLWAESLGKAHDRKGKPVHVGQTPVVALGATDQHSQLQLYMEGPADKTFSFWVVDEFRATVRLPSNWSDLASTGYLGKKSFNRLIAAEQRAVDRALAEVGRPSVTFRLPHIDEAHIGEMIALFELQTALAGEMYDVDAYDQPGVEAGKRSTYALMGRKGYEELAAEIEAGEKEVKRAIV
jgi:glucose-6-phosphate isomerase